MGHHNRHFAGDPHSLAGAWSPPTSAANFCEEDYAFTRYIAEFINSLTNLAYVYFALRYMYGPGSRGIFSPKLDYMSVTLLILGISSFLFHASLRQHLQFADDLSMIGLVWSFLQGTWTARQPPARARIITASFTVAIIAFSVFYVWSGEIIYHVVAFLTLLGLVGVRIRYLFHWMQPAFPKAKSSDWNNRVWKATFISLFGYVLWNIDLEFCAELRQFREQIGLPWAWVFELHGWWHILTAIGASQFMDTVREMRAELEKEKKK